MKKYYLTITLLLSVITPGLGHFFCGSIKQAGLLYSIGLSISLIFFLTFYHSFYGLVLFIILIAIHYLFSIGDSFRTAFCEQELNTKTQFNRWYIYFFIGFFHLAIVLPILFFFVSPLKLYRVPSESMLPTLIPGDYFFVSRKYSHKNVSHRGDIVVFTSPKNDNVNFVKRIVGLPNESIRVLGDTVFINGDQLKESYQSIDLPFHDYSDYEIYSVQIPATNVYVLGDNRDSSYDSRYFGSIKKSSLKGKALYILYSQNHRRIGQLL